MKDKRNLLAMGVVPFLMFTSALLGQSSGPRDLTKYRTRAPIDISLADAERGQKEADIRAFIWENWRKHRRAHVIQSSVNIEGERSVTEFFVEPDPRGNWNVEVTIQREILPRGQPNPT